MDNELRVLFREGKRCRKMRIFLQQIGTKSNLATHLCTPMKPLFSHPTTIYEDNKGAADCINTYKVTSNLCYVELPLRYLHKLHELGILTFKHCSGQVMFANILIKEGLQRPPSSTDIITSLSSFVFSSTSLYGSTLDFLF